MGFTAEGAIYGTFQWHDELPPFELQDERFAADRTQRPQLTIDHTAHVYFADYDKPYAYFVIDHMKVEASPGERLVNTTDARGYFNSSAHVAYRSVTASDDCKVTKTASGPFGLKDDFRFVFQGTEMTLNAAKSTGEGRVVFRPDYTTEERHVAGWSIERAAGKSGWVIHQRDVWNALDVDGGGGADAGVVRQEWLDAFFNGTPFGRIKEMPPASYGTVGCELFTMWKIDKTKGEFTPDSREATLTLDIDYIHRLSLFHNARITPPNEARRAWLDWSPRQPATVLRLHEIARRS